MSCRAASLALFALLTLALPAGALAGPGPDGVVVVAHADRPESLALARRYAEARAIPDAQLCALSLGDADPLPLDAYRSRLEAPLLDCLGAAADRIEAAVLIRGVPRRVEIPSASGPLPVSTAAALATWRSTLVDDGRPLLGEPPARLAQCAGGQPCWQGVWRNPLLDARPFSAGWSRRAQGVDWRPLIVTAIDARSAVEAARLIASATTAEAVGRVDGPWILMSGADPARGSLDRSLPGVIDQLVARGLDARPAPFDAELADDAFGAPLAAFVTGTAGIGRSIEGQRFAPGAVVDNLTSFGAVPANFDPDPGRELQVSIARWVARGVAGVHGTTDEPLADSFPDRRFLVDYADGAALGEAYARRLPYAYWRNLVLGDPLAAPWARRPEVRLELDASGPVRGSLRVRLSAEDPGGRGVDRLRLLVDGAVVAESSGAPIERCLALPVGARVQLLGVARSFELGAGRGGFSPSGWVERRLVVEAGPSDCPAAPAVDAGLPPDAGAPGADAGLAPDAAGPPDAGPGTPGEAPAPASEGCHDTSGGGLGGFVLVVLFALRARRRPDRRALLS